MDLKQALTCHGKRIKIDKHWEVYPSDGAVFTEIWTGRCQECKEGIGNYLIVKNTFGDGVQVKRYKHEPEKELARYIKRFDKLKADKSFDQKASKSNWLYGFNNAAIDFNTGRVKYSAKELEAKRVKA